MVSAKSGGDEFKIEKKGFFKKWFECCFEVNLV